MTRRPASVGIRLEPKPWCPYCGAKMVLRTNRHTGDRFWGCSQYPDCKGTRDIDPDTGESVVYGMDGRPR